ncbi:MAG: tripartite tricarboxylate transporter substrate binding protein [Burkholderiaceae bacterium]
MSYNTVSCSCSSVTRAGKSGWNGKGLGFKLMLAASLLAYGSFALAQTFPTKQVRILVGYAPGGGTDIFSRLLANKLTEMWGQPVVVENRTGATGTIAADYVAKSSPDGHTVLMTVPNTHTILPQLSRLPYDPLRDFTPITLAVQVPHVLVVGLSVPANNMAELVAMAKANPSKINFSSSGPGSTQQLAGELLNQIAGIKAVHVPYRGSAAAMLDLVAGGVTLSLDTTSSSMGQIRAGKLKPLAVAAPNRVAALPQIPTTAEAGYPGVEMITWYGMFGPAGMAKPVLDKWQQDVAKVLQMPDVRERILQLAGEPVGNKPEEFDAYVRAEFTKTGKLVKEANIKAE